MVVNRSRPYFLDGVTPPCARRARRATHVVEAEPAARSGLFHLILLYATCNA